MGQNIAILVSNHSGVLARVAAQFSRHGLSIDALTMRPSAQPELATIVAAVHEEPERVSALCRQLEKLEDVRRVCVRPQRIRAGNHSGVQDSTQDHSAPKETQEDREDFR